MTHAANNDSSVVASEKPSLVVIAGPTGVGKTSVAIALARPIRGEIIGADAMQVYRRLNIGTAKPTPEEQALVRHHLVDVADPDEPFTAARFRALASAVIDDLYSKGTPIFLVGGTGLYIKALTGGLFEAKDGDEEIRKRLHEELRDLGPAILYDRLVQVDPAAASRIHPNDTYRIVRALEVFEATGRPISQHHDSHGFSRRPYRVLKIGLHLDREVLYERINDRVDQMLCAGLVDEVKGLLAQGYSPGLKALQSLGYGHVMQYLQGETVWDEMVRLFKRDTRRYAKRQLTWFRADSEMAWFEPTQVDRIRTQVDAFLTG